MKIIIENTPQTEEEHIVIRSCEMSERMACIIRYIKLNEQMIPGYEGRQMTWINLLDILFIESVDEKVFAYTKDNVYELKHKLYEFESEYGALKFVRCAKSMIVNLMKIKQVAPLNNGRLTARLFNGEDLIISRKYVPTIKRMYRCLEA